MSCKNTNNAGKYSQVKQGIISVILIMVDNKKQMIKENKFKKNDVTNQKKKTKEKEENVREQYLTLFLIIIMINFGNTI